MKLKPWLKIQLVRGGHVWSVVWDRKSAKSRKAAWVVLCGWCGHCIISTNELQSLGDFVYTKHD